MKIINCFSDFIYPWQLQKVIMCMIFHAQRKAVDRNYNIYSENYLTNWTVFSHPWRFLLTDTDLEGERPILIFFFEWYSTERRFFLYYLLETWFKLTYHWWHKHSIKIWPRIVADSSSAVRMHLYAKFDVIKFIHSFIQTLRQFHLKIWSCIVADSFILNVGMYCSR